MALAAISSTTFDVGREQLTAGPAHTPETLCCRNAPCHGDWKPLSHLAATPLADSPDD
jgi:hypothetical protein